MEKRGGGPQVDIYISTATVGAKPGVLPFPNASGKKNVSGHAALSHPLCSHTSLCVVHTSVCVVHAIYRPISPDHQPGTLGLDRRLHCSAMSQDDSFSRTSSSVGPAGRLLVTGAVAVGHCCLVGPEVSPLQ